MEKFINLNLNVTTGKIPYFTVFGQLLRIASEETAPGQAFSPQDWKKLLGQVKDSKSEARKKPSPGTSIIASLD